MVGPGTGIAPFRAFLQERRATARAGPQLAVLRPPAQRLRFLLRRRTQRDEAERRADAPVAGVVARRRGEDSTCRTGCARSGASCGRWLAEGAHLYICGDAKRMAKDVEAALVDIVAAHGARSTDEAVLFVSELKKKGRFQQDVY
jgi:sulfite reductase (NADPH) flavoprotein alpha-component